MGYSSKKHDEFMGMRTKYLEEDAEFAGEVVISKTLFAYPTCKEGGSDFPGVQQLLARIGNVPAGCAPSKQTTYALHRFLSRVFYDYCYSRQQRKKAVKPYRVLFIVDTLDMLKACDEEPSKLPKLIEWLAELEAWTNKDYFESSSSSGDISDCLQKLLMQLRHIEDYAYRRRQTIKPAEHQLRHFPGSPKENVKPVLSKKLPTGTYLNVLAGGMSALSQINAELASYIDHDVSDYDNQAIVAQELAGFFENVIVRVEAVHDRFRQLFGVRADTDVVHKLKPVIVDSDDEDCGKENGDSRSLSNVAPFTPDYKVKNREAESNFQYMVDLIQRDLNDRLVLFDNEAPIYEGESLESRALKFNVLVDVIFLMRRCFRDEALSLSDLMVFFERQLLVFWHGVATSGEVMFYHDILNQLKAMHHAARLSDSFQDYGRSLGNGISCIDEKFQRVVVGDRVREALSTEAKKKRNIADVLEGIAKSVTFKTYVGDKVFSTVQVDEHLVLCAQFTQKVIEAVAMIRILKSEFVACCRAVTQGVLFLVESPCSLVNGVVEAEEKGMIEAGTIVSAMDDCLKRLKESLDWLQEKAGLSPVLIKHVDQLEGCQKDVERSQHQLLELKQLLSFRPVLHGHFAVVNDDADGVRELKGRFAMVMNQYEEAIRLVEINLINQPVSTNFRASVVEPSEWVSDLPGGVVYGRDSVNAGQMHHQAGGSSRVNSVDQVVNRTPFEGGGGN